MDVLTPVVTGVLLAIFTSIQYWSNKGRFDAIDRRIDSLEVQLRGEIAQVRADLLQLALALGTRQQPQTG